MQNQTLHAWKAVACLGVIFIHMSLPGGLGAGVTALARAGVALFFLISGYYLYAEDRQQVLAKLRRRIPRIAALTAAAFVLYFLWESFVRVWSGGLTKLFAWYGEELFVWPNLLRVLFLSYDPVATHLWFLLALLQGYVVLWLLFRVRAEGLAFVTALPLLAVHLIVMAVCARLGQIVPVFVFRNVWFYGLPFLVLGMWFRRREAQGAPPVSAPVWAALIVAGCALSLTERAVFGDLELFFGTVLLASGVFLHAVGHPRTAPVPLLSAVGARYATGIYVLHWAVKECFHKLRTLFALDPAWFDWVAPFGVFLVTLCAVALWDVCKRRILSARASSRR